jgi:hypothetical protein
MNQTIPYNSPIKSCETCAHYRRGVRGMRVRDDMPIIFNKCDHFEAAAEEVLESRCTLERIHWRPIPPKPPRRSLRRWLADILWS